MIVFNTFTNYQRIKKLPEIDILIWTTCLIRYKQLGYETKLFCTPEDISFLKENHLFHLYDIIDVDLFRFNEKLKLIDNKHFWSSRKIEALYYQYCVLEEPAIYSDVDIIMRSKFDLSKDALVWSPEDWNTNEGQVYVPWRNLSKPKGYQMPKYIIDTKDAYNCGVLWFKNKEIFEQYYNEYYGFVMNNPCEIKTHKSRGDDVEDLITNNSVWACNAEQRILKAVLDYNNQDVACVMYDRKKGSSKQGIHFFFYRIGWQYLKSKEWEPTPDALPMLNLTIYECLKSIEHYIPKTYEWWVNKSWLKDFFEKVDFKNKIYPVREYY